MSELTFNQKYEKFEKIGEGAFKVVYRGENKLTKEKVAIKETPLYNYENYDVKLETEKEIKFMKALNGNPHSLKLLDIFEENNTIYIVTELCEGDLYKILQKSKKGFTVYEVKIIMKQLNNVLEEMRKKNMVHNDFKVENILVKFKENSKEFEMKISDFGLSKVLSTTKDLKNNEWGIEPFEGPKEEVELLEKVDLLRIGVNIYRMLFNAPYRTYDKMFKKIDKFIEDEDLKDLLRKLLVDDPKERINWDDYFKHKFFNIDKFDFDKVENIVKA